MTEVTADLLLTMYSFDGLSDIKYLLAVMCELWWFSLHFGSGYLTISPHLFFTCKYYEIRIICDIETIASGIKAVQVTLITPGKIVCTSRLNLHFILTGRHRQTIITI